MLFLLHCWTFYNIICILAVKINRFKEIVINFSILHKCYYVFLFAVLSYSSRWGRFSLNKKSRKSCQNLLTNKLISCIIIVMWLIITSLLHINRSKFYHSFGRFFYCRPTLLEAEQGGYFFYQYDDKNLLALIILPWYKLIFYR